MSNNMNNNNEFPSFSELKVFVTNHPRSSVCEIRDHFNQQGDDTITIPKEGCKFKRRVVAYAIRADFYSHLKEFIKKDYIKLDLCRMSCMVSDSTIYHGKHEFLPVLLTVI